MDYFIVILSAYLLGSLNFAIVISKWFLKKDIRQQGSKNAGATNALRIMGAKVAILVLLGDMLKGVLAVLIGNHFLGDVGKLIAGGIVVIGHIFPLFFKFKGGKGVATVAGAMLAFDLRIFIVIVIIFFTMLAISKMVSLSAICASTYLPIGMYINYEEVLFPVVGLLLCLGIIYMHRANIARIIARQESKISFKRK